MKHFDIIIIGGGPAGAMCGIQLQKLGIKSCILDKAKFPRTKLCGGLLTQKTIDLISTYCPNILQESYIVNSSHSVDFYNKTDRICKLKSSVPFYFTNRLKFDSILINEYKKQGGILIENARIKAADINYNKQTVSVYSSELSYKYLIGADGVQSVLMQKQHIKRHDLFCLEGETDKSDTSTSECCIYFNCVKNGYGWKFPKDNYHTIGLGGSNQNKSIKIDAEHFFKKIEPKTLNNIKGAFIPSGKLPQSLKLHDKTIAIGDAGGFVDPITGEGLYYALYSGIQAAQAISDGMKNEAENINKIFLKRIKSELKNIAFAYKLQKLLFNPKITSIFLRLLVKHQGFAQFYLEDLMSTKKYNYRNFILAYIIKVKLTNKFRHKK